MRFNIHAGHNPDGKIACGAVGIIKESTEARLVKNEVIRLLREAGHTVHDCTVDDGVSQNNVLAKIVEKCNSNVVDYDISIHFNAGNGNGTEAYVYPGDDKSKKMADAICASIAKLGFKNRGTKENRELYVLRRTKSSAILVECCFVDSSTDTSKYKASEMAFAIASALDTTIARKQTSTDSLYRVQVGAFSKKENAEKLLLELANKGFKGFITK